MNKLTAALLLLTFAACGPGGVTLTLDKQTVTRGGSLKVTLHNGGLDQIGYNLCDGPFLNDQRVSGRSMDIACPDIEYPLGGLQSAGFTFDVTDTAPAGTYRYSTSVKIAGTLIPIVSPEVTIEP